MDRGDKHSIEITFEHWQNLQTWGASFSRIKLPYSPTRLNARAAIKTAVDCTSSFCICGSSNSMLCESCAIVATKTKKNPVLMSKVWNTYCNMIDHRLIYLCAVAPWVRMIIIKKNSFFFKRCGQLMTCVSSLLRTSVGISRQLEMRILQHRHRKARQ